MNHFSLKIYSTRPLQQLLATKVSVVAEKNYVQARNRPETFWQTSARTRPDSKSPDGLTTLLWQLMPPSKLF